MTPLVCQHGSLARKCAVCERDADIKELRTLLIEARARHTPPEGAADMDFCARIDTALANHAKIDQPPSPEPDIGTPAATSANAAADLARAISALGEAAVREMERDAALEEAERVVLHHLDKAATIRQAVAQPGMVPELSPERKQEEHRIAAAYIALRAPIRKALRALKSGAKPGKEGK